MMIISTDGHIGQAYDGYRDFIDPAYRDRLADLADDQAFYNNLIYGQMGKLPPEVARIVDERGVRTGVPEEYWDLEKRLAELDIEGIAGEFVIADSSRAPFFSSLGSAFPRDVRTAGIRAYHRWAAEMFRAAEGRLVGNAEPCPDIAEAVAELPWLAEHGFVSVTVPGAIPEPDDPPLESPYYDPFWAACEELGIALNIHAGWGREQGTAMDFFRPLLAGNGPTNTMEAGSDSSEEKNEEVFDALTKKADAKNPNSPLALTLKPQQVMWRLMLGGVFDRFPRLKLVLTEVRADWVRPMLTYLDQRFAERAPKVELTPSEYYERNCAVTPTAPHRAEIEILDQIGVSQFMFGADIPHPEGTWPNSRDWIRDVFRSVPEDQLRMILGENALRHYNIDPVPLEKVAARLAVQPGDLVSRGELDERMLEHFDARSGYRRPADPINEEQIGSDLEDDFARILA